MSYIVPKSGDDRASVEAWLTSVYGRKPTRGQLLDELCDYRMVMSNVALVYDHVTGGAIAKVNTSASVVIAHADDLLTQRVEEELAERVLFAGSEANTGKTGASPSPGIISKPTPREGESR